MREQYRALMADPAKIEEILQAGAQKATAFSAPLMRELRHAVGLRKLVSTTPLKSSHQKQKSLKAHLPSFKQYREADGQFYFKLLSPEGKLLMQSNGYATPREAAAAIATLHQQGATALPELQKNLRVLTDLTAGEIETALELLVDNLKTD